MKELIVKTSLVTTLILGSAYLVEEHFDQAKVEQLQEKYKTDVNLLHVKLDDTTHDRDLFKKRANDALNENAVLKQSLDSVSKQKSNLENQLNQKDQVINSQSAEINKLKKQNDQRPSRSSVATSSPAASQASNSAGWQTFSASAYTTAENGDPWTSGKWGNKTASGTTPKQGRTIAVDRKLIPLGTKLQVEFPEPYGYLNGIYTAEDTGNAIKGNKVDLYLGNYQDCVNFGVRSIKIKVL